MRILSNRPTTCVALLTCFVVFVSLADDVRAEVAKGTREQIPGIAFVGGPVIDGEYDGQDGSYHWRDGYVYPRGATFNAWERTTGAMRPGRNLYALVPATPDGKLTQLTFLKEGNVFDPEPSFDGTRLLFSMRKDNEDWFHLFEINIDGTGLRQLTDGPFSDLSGVYLPDGGILFCSDRTGVLDEYHEERSEFLFRMNADGTNLEQLTFVPGIYFEPTVLRNGSILCSFWDAFQISVPPFIKHETYLITLRPDGTEERPLFGAGEHRFYNRTRHASVGLTRAGELPDGRILVQSEMGPSIYDPNLGQDLGKSLTPVFPPTTSAQTGGTTHAVHLSPLGTRSSPYPLEDGRFLLSATLPGSRDIGLYVADPQTRSLEKIYDRPNLSEWDAVPIGMARPKPRNLPEKQREKSSEFATFVVVSGRTSDTPERNELNKRARFARVLAAEYTAVTTSSHTSLETRILGTVPVQPDGSIAFEAPAETPLFLETEDARGNRLVLQGGYMTARAGEVKSCFGCHAPQSEAVPNSIVRALQLPLVRITRESTDQSYRRNDPEEYRRHAIIGQSPLYRTWLRHENPEIRRRGLEALAALPDEVSTEDRARFVELLADRVVDVRRQAAHALAIAGSADQIPELIMALQDDDWVTRHYLAMALEAITGEQLELAADSEQAAAVWSRWWKETGSVEAFLTALTPRSSSFPNDFARDAWLEAVSRTRWLANEKTREVAAAERPRWLTTIRAALSTEPPLVPAVKAAGMLADAQSVPSISPWLIRGLKVQSADAVPDSIDALRREMDGIALGQAAATALGRIGTPEAVQALWSAVETAVPNMTPGGVRHYQTGPRPEEYTYLRALIYAGAVPSFDRIKYLIALLPYTEGEKPRFEDRAKIDSQRVWLGRILLNRMNRRQDIVKLAVEILRGTARTDDPLHQEVLAGTNLDRPRSEHGRMFPVVNDLEAEQALHLLACLAESKSEIPEELLAQALHSSNHRERIDASVVLRRLGFSKSMEAELLAEIGRPYAFHEVGSIGKGRPDPDFRDKSYLLMALAAHASDPSLLAPFTDYRRYYRDIRIGLALGLGFRGTADGYPLLKKLADDPIFVVHRLSQQAGIDIRDAEMFAGRTAPPPRLPPHVPLKPDHKAAQEFAFSDRTPDPVAKESRLRIDVNDPRAAILALRSAVDESAYRNVANSFARNAERMRVVDAGVLADIVESPQAREIPMTQELTQALTTALDSPYPFARYLAARLISNRAERSVIPQLVRKLPEAVKTADTVGFYWMADALGRLRAPEAVPVLREFARAEEFPRTHGPIGMAYGFGAARGIGLAASDADAALVDALLHSDNVWLRAGVLDGLIENGDRGLAALLEKVLAEQPGAILSEEAHYGLEKIKTVSRN